jgi:hypothetical protein
MKFQFFEISIENSKKIFINSQLYFHLVLKEIMNNFMNEQTIGFMKFINQKKQIQFETSVKIKYRKKKIRTNLPKRCGSPQCTFNQYFETLEDAEKHLETFQTLKGRSAYCPCGCTIQYFSHGKWVRSTTLSNLLRKKKLKQENKI